MSSACKIIFEHLYPAFLIVHATIGSFSVDHKLKKEVRRDGPTWGKYLNLAVLFVLHLCNLVRGIATYDLKFYCALYYSPTCIDLSNIWILLLSVIVTDFLVKLLTQLVKFFVLGFSDVILPFRSRGKYYSFIEHTSQLYRFTLPFLPWYSYFRHAYPKEESHIILDIFGYELLILYCTFKTVFLVVKIKYWFKSVKKLFTHKYGRTPTPAELEAAGSDAQCAICYDEFKSPTRLLCVHIYCKDCISQWLDRHRTCPTCRVDVSDTPTFHDGSTSHFVQAF